MRAANVERWLLVVTPFVAMTAVGVGLRLGASDAISAATVSSAPMARAGLGLAWQVVAFRVNHDVREPLSGRPLEVTARAGTSTARWSGSTNEDGIAEIALPVRDSDVLSLEIRSGSEVLAVGDARVPPRLERGPVAPVWMPFARKEGPIELDVAVLGQRLAPGFPGSVWIRATDAATHARLSGIAFQADADGTLILGPASPSSADGWGELTATAMGFAISLAVQARGSGARAGQWRGGLFASPGAPQIATRRRWAPDAAPSIAIVAPTPRTTEYLEIDDASGRVWATAAALARTADGTSRADVAAPALPPGLYWAVAASDPGGATLLGPGTMAVPFFVASSDAAALELGTDRIECAPRSSALERAQALGPCLALAAAAPISRWTALDGFSKKLVKLREERLRGLGVAAAALLVAMALETLLVLRAAARGRRLGRDELGEGASEPLAMSPPFPATAAVLMALLGFALVAAFILRWA